MRTDSREMLGLGIFGRASLRERIEVLVRRGGGLSAGISCGRVVAGVGTLMILAGAGSVAPRWIAFAQQSDHPSFEVASVKQNTSTGGLIRFSVPPIGNRFTATNASLRMLITFAFDLKNFEVAGGPGWIDSDRYDVDAKASESNLSQSQSRLMLQTLLNARFNLKVHQETKEVAVYALLAGRNGPKLAKANPANCVAWGGNESRPPASGLTTGAASACSVRQFLHRAKQSRGRRNIDSAAR